MALYHFAVTEVRTYEMRYAVQADTLDLALEKAVIGETVAETQIRCSGVVDRHLDVDPNGEPPQAPASASALVASRTGLDNSHLGQACRQRAAPAL